jgi:hypothetical protein
MQELEDELEFEDETGLHEEESEGIFGAIGNVLGNLLGESEDEYEYEVHEHELEHGEAGLHEFEHGEMHEFEHGEAGLHEYEHGEGGLHEDEFEHGEAGLHEFEHGEIHEFEHGEAGLHEYEFEHGEHFFRGIRNFIRRAAPMLKQIARVAVPMVTSAVGGPLGGMLGNVAQGVLGEGEYELEDEYEFEDEASLHEYEAALAAPLTESQALAELMAAAAAEAYTESEAEAMIGAATVYALSARERREIRRVIAHLVRGTAILTRLLRRRRMTRPAVRAVPAIVHATANTLTRRAAAGQPVTRRIAGRVMAAHTRRVLSSPHVCGRALQRNVRATRTIQARTGIPTVSWRPTPATVRRARAVANGTPRRRVVR